MPQLAFSLAKESESVGVTEVPVSTRAIPLVNPHQAWVVIQGKLDLFLAAFRDGEPTGARYPVMRVEAGSMAVGIEPVGGVALIACPAPGTKLAQVPAGSLYRGHIRSIDTPENLMEGWICGLADALGAAGSPLLSPMCITAGELISVGETPKIISSKNRLAWVTHRSGSSSFIGSTSVNGNSGLFPLARQCWMEASPGAQIYAAQAAEHETLDPDWIGLHKFCKLALGTLAEQFQQSGRLDCERMQVKVLADRLLLDRTMHRLAAPVQEIAEPDDGDDSCHHPIFLACRMIGSRMGFKVHAHPDLMRSIPTKDPVAAIARASNVRVRRVTLKGQWWKSETGGLLCFEEETNAPLAVEN